MATINRLVLWAQTYNRALPDHRHHLLTASDADGAGRPGMGGKIVGDVLFTLADPNVLIAADLREHLHATEKGRGAIDKSRRAIERIRHDTVNPDVGMVGLEGLQASAGRVVLWWDTAGWEPVWAAAVLGGHLAS